MKNNSRKRAHKPVHGFLKDPLTYAGIGFTVAPYLIEKYLIGMETIKNADWPMKAPLMASVFSTMFVGNVLLLYSLRKNFGFGIVEAVQFQLEYYKFKHNETKYWAWFGEGLEKLKAVESPELAPLVKRGERFLEERKNLKDSCYLLKEAAGIIRKRKAREERLMNETQSVQVAEDTYRHRKRAYDSLSENARLRVGYLTKDITGLVEDQSVRDKLQKNVYDSRWFGLGLTDMQTYMLFDDITLKVRQGIIPSTSEINSYAAKVLKETAQSKVA